ncbi:MAG: sodium:solute symporter family protein [Deltaproteobacteria bacterium]|jgi:SSS family solute:Na+ symporter|nr:sodium:solute symporter family protein [Deltaproteobacteria bacterium]
MNEFFLANRQLGGFVSAMSYAATTYSAFMMVGLAGLTYKMGVGALGFELTYLCGLVLVVFFGPRFWLVGRRYDYLTHAQLLADRYESRAVGIVAALLCLIFLIPYAAIQLMGIGYLVSVISKGAISLMTAMILATSIAIVWSNIAGLRSVAWTDALQALTMLITSIWVLFLVVDKGFGGFNAFFEQMEQQTPRLLAGAGLFKFNVFFGLALPWLFFPLSNPQVSQRLFVPKSVKAFKQMIGGFLIFGFIYTLVSIFWGFSARLLIPGLKEADLATPSLLALPVVPGIIVVIVMVGILSAAISTIDSILLSLSSMCARDIVKNGLHAEISEKTELIVGKLIIPVLAAVFLLFAFWAVGKSGFAFMIAPLSAAASAGLLMAVPAIIGAFFWKRATAAGALGSMIGGAATVLLLQLTGYKPLGMWPGVWGLAVCLILYVAISLLTVAPIRKAEDFIGYINQNLSKYKFV